MKLGEIPTVRQQASTYLKLLVGLVVVLIVALAYLVWTKSSAPKLTDADSDQPSKTAMETLPLASEWKTCTTEDSYPTNETDLKNFVAVTADQKAEISSIKVDSGWTKFKGSSFTMMLPPGWKTTIVDESAPPPSDKAYPGKQFRIDFTGPSPDGVPYASIRVYDVASFGPKLDQIDPRVLNPQSQASRSVSVTEFSINGAPASIICSNERFPSGEVAGYTKDYNIKSKGTIYQTETNTYGGYFYFRKEAAEFAIDLDSAKRQRQFQIAIESIELN